MKKIYLIPDLFNIEESCTLAKEYNAGFEYNDFYEPQLLDNPNALRERIEFYKGLDRDCSEDTLHGAFYDITIHSDDPLICEASKLRVHQCMEVAKELGVRGVVFHTGTIPNFKGEYYSNNWLRKNAEFWIEICDKYSDVEVYMENMFDMECELLCKLGEMLKNVKNFGICLDYAHAKIFGKTPDLWLERLAPYIKHLHINDNDGIEDLHNAVGDGLIDWKLFDKGIRDRKLSPSVLIETKSLNKQRKSLEYMKTYNIYPFFNRKEDY